MRTFESANGGVPVYADDLLFINDGHKALIDALIASWGEDFTLSGVNYTNNGGTLEWDNGFIVLGGEVCRVLTDSATKPATGLSDNQERDQGAGPYWEKSDEVDTDGDRTLLAGGSHSPWKIRTATLKTSVSTGAYTHGTTGWHPSGIASPSLAYANRVQSKVKSFLLNNVAEKFVTSGELLNDWTTSANQHLYLRKSWDNMVTITGTVDGTSATGLTIYQVPALYRSFINGDIASGAKFASGSGHITLDSSGNLIASASGGVFSFTMTFLGT